MVKDDHVARTILLLEGKKQGLEFQLAEVDKCLSGLKQLFVIGTEKPVVEKPVAEKPVRQLKSKRTKSSKYKGVSLVKSTKSKGPRFAATYWDGIQKKAVHLGMFDNEKLAAAAYEKHVANKKKADAQVKSDTQEQAENNPDRPTRKMKVWLCTHCKLEQRHPTQPMRCVGCDGASFKDTGRKE